MCSKSMGVVSKRTILAHHPFVEDVNEEMKQIETEEAQNNTDMYDDWHSKGHDDGSIDDHDDDHSDDE